MRRGTLVVMVKEPRAGRVKTRLGAEIGMTAAAMWYRHQVRALMRRIEDPRWQVALAIAPDRALISRAFPPGPLRVAQGGGDLGLRMMRGLRAFRGPVVLIGSDIPGVTRAHIAEAFRALGSAASVIGPSVDGGFWLIGLRHPGRHSQRLFERVEWSSPRTLEDTVPRLPCPVARATTLADVDEAADLPAKDRDGSCVT